MGHFLSTFAGGDFVELPRPWPRRDCKANMQQWRNYMDAHPAPPLDFDNHDSRLAYYEWEFRYEAFLTINPPFYVLGAEMHFNSAEAGARLTTFEADFARDMQARADDAHMLDDFQRWRTHRALAGRAESEDEYEGSISEDEDDRIDDARIRQLDDAQYVLRMLRDGLPP